MSLARFPRSALRGDQTIHRIHRANFNPWWFSGDGSGRFDPVGTGLGACYLAKEPLGAWVETFRDQMAWQESDVADRRLLSVELRRTLRLADLTSPRCLSFGVTATLSAGSDYEAGHTFAAAALAAGYQGVRYWVRHDPRQKPIGYAIFGDAGPSDVWPPRTACVLPRDLIALACSTFGYRILPRP